VTEHTECPLASSTRRVAIYISNADSRLAANQRAAMQRYADNMAWRVTVIEDDRQRLLDGAATSAFDLVLCWRTDDLRDAEFLFERLSAHGVDILAVAQSCAALSE
jgi:DNA invertase Pin-like site-specific DNA recombinase